MLKNTKPPIKILHIWKNYKFKAILGCLVSSRSSWGRLVPYLEKKKEKERKAKISPVVYNEGER